MFIAPSRYFSSFYESPSCIDINPRCTGSPSYNPSHYLSLSLAEGSNARFSSSSSSSQGAAAAASSNKAKQAHSKQAPRSCAKQLKCNFCVATIGADADCAFDCGHLACNDCFKVNKRIGLIFSISFYNSHSTPPPIPLDTALASLTCHSSSYTTDQHTLSLTDPLTHIRYQHTLLLTHPLTDTPSRSHTLSFTHPLTHTPYQHTLSLTHPINTPSHSHTLSLTYPINTSSHSHTLSPYQHTLSLRHPLDTHTLSLTHTLNTPSRLPRSRTKLVRGARDQIVNIFLFPKGWTKNVSRTAVKQRLAPFCYLVSAYYGVDLVHIFFVKRRYRNAA